VLVCSLQVRGVNKLLAALSGVSERRLYRGAGLGDCAAARQRPMPLG
jgi:hypothetical protein